MTMDMQTELVDVTPVLEAAMHRSSDAVRGLGVDLIDGVHIFAANLAVDAYKAGVNAATEAAKRGEVPDSARDRLNFRADLALLMLKGRESLTDESTEVTALLDSTPSYIPFDGLPCMAEDIDFSDGRMEPLDRLAKSILDNFEYCSDEVLEAIVAELGFRYGGYLKSQGVEGSELANRVKAFEVKQMAIIRESLTSKELRQPDQDDHAYQHFVDDLMYAGKSVWGPRGRR
jgi:hypothetical protein